ncbi:matrixin family metalloprotease [Synechococcus sp. Tobar12-5m-g]|uniref:matrixin family metalloprotease n=1 Tax=unclassified Synechococcus TaxID=2626047 RepID=UPI0020CFDEC6|nr:MULTISPECIES: matrixin family metalloprotease [unclassified Synechococcus]MCP9772946.1 matrixin family metalloprotease [Synechococcus sp. Tobar12-5m-g]MCP9873741.1 matrixin family metalloprotease [Synechococcus sp. Cruz CV-v-12]
MGARLAARLLALPLLAVALPLLADPGRAVEVCPLAQTSRPWVGSGRGSAPPRETLPAEAPSGDYRQVLEPSAAGWPVLPQWCVWVEPVSLEGPAARFQLLWLQAVEAALGQWQDHLPLKRVEDPQRAQVLVRRQRPPRLQQAAGQARASHGRASLSLQDTERLGVWRLEPRVEVLISPEQRRAAIEATALHELGHAFGLWGHSPDPADVMAAVPGAEPVLRLSPRDLATLRWLYSKPSPFGSPPP